MVQKCIFILVFLTGAIIAVPLKGSSVRFKREDESTNLNGTSEFNGCILDEVEYKPGQEVPSLGPCESCTCEAPDVVCSMIKCQPNSGCRIIQQSGQCCPEYKCDCEYNGRVYNNGERLDKPEDPCQVCYCKGGEIMCTSITCYERDDCLPHFSPGQCCPKYDHCPVEADKVSNNSIRSVNTTLYSPKREMQPWLLTKPSDTPSTVNYDSANGSQNNVYPKTIKIVEILPTTPNYVNRPSEVSVMPRVKSNEDESKAEYSKTPDTSLLEETTTDLVSTTELTRISGTSSTSEIEHLMDTTTQSEVEIVEQTTEVVPEIPFSITNPLSVEVPITPSLDTEPASLKKLATVFPSHHYTSIAPGDAGEGTTPETTTEVTGTGYDLLKGGVYEEYSSELPEYYGLEHTTKADEILSTNQESLDNIDNINNESQYSPNYASPTGTENYSSEEYLSSTDKISERNSVNNSSFDVLNSEGSSDESKASYQTNTTNSAEIVLGNADIKVENNTSVSYEGTTNFSAENSTEFVTWSENYSSSGSHPASKESSSENTYGEFSTEQIVQESIVTFPEKITDKISTFEVLVSPKSISADIETMSTGPEEYSETATDPGVLNPKKEVSTFATDENKKLSRLTNRKLEPVINDLERGSTLNFPSVLNVQTLKSEQISSQTESGPVENSTSMAKIGIYHPTKANELAGYLTIVDVKTNNSSPNVTTFSSHLLLTPHDLKKLAEILIHEKIKPVTKQDINSTTDLPEENVQEGERKINDFHNPTISSEEGQSNEDFSKDLSNVTNLSNSDDITSEDYVSVSTGTNDEIQDDTERHFDSTTSENIVLHPSEDSNAPRQIRTPDSSSFQYSSLLDERDLLILKDFLRKNIGLH